MMFEWRIGWAQVRAKRRDRFISFISLLSTVAIALGVAALVVVMSVIDGLQGEIRERILGVAPHAEIGSADGRLTDWEEVLRMARAQPGVAGAAPFVRGQALLAAGGAVRGVELRGIVPETESAVSAVGSRLLSGRLTDLQAGEFGLVLGAEVARALRVMPGDRITVISPQGTVTPAGILPRMKVFRVTGVFEAGMPEFDAGLAFTHLVDAQRLYRLGSAVSGVRLRAASLTEAPRLARDLAARRADLVASDWTRTHAAFFRALEIERVATLVMLSLIVAVAAFNVVSMLVMAVNEKRPEIAILRTMGAMPRSILAIFMTQGMVLGVVGTLAGALVGTLLALHLGTLVGLLDSLLPTGLLPPALYYLSLIPAQVQAAQVALVMLLSLLLSLLATLYPSARAARIRPAEALRHA
jgi:lipoprotein-releasing system permease protein